MKSKRTSKLRRPGQFAGAPGSAIPLEELKAAMAKDFEQQMIDSYTPDRLYPFPTDNVRALIAKYWPNESSSDTAAPAVRVERKGNL